MRKCIKCGRELPEGVLFCLECGAAQDPRLAPLPRRRVPAAVWLVLAAAILIPAVVVAILTLRPVAPRQDPPAAQTGAPARETAGTATLTETVTAEETETIPQTTAPDVTAPAVTSPLTTGQAAPDHVHQYASTVVREAGCTTRGTVRYRCSCGASYTEELPALGHSWEDSVTRAATCTAAGELTHRCTRCGAATTETIPPAAHAFALTAGTAATCSEASKGAQYTCGVCGLTESREEPPLGHSTTDGTCSRCGAFCHGDIAVINWLGSLHYYDNEGGVPIWFYVDSVRLSVRDGALYMSGVSHLKTDAPTYYAYAPFSGRVRAYIQNQYRKLTVVSRECEVMPRGTPNGANGVFDGVYLAEWSTLENYGGKTFYLRFDDAARDLDW
ncbi:MAG: zinc ribbon domain-containing protein [Clostridia bacterium]|nr:zinc ribbon domain-containing protein [Clostridia bacterium]